MDRLALVMGDFPQMPLSIMQEKIAHSNNDLVQSYVSLADLIDRSDQQNSSWRTQISLRQRDKRLSPDRLAETIRSCKDPTEKGLLEQLQEARKARVRRKESRTNVIETVECGCCFEDTPIDTMVRCQGEQPHVS